MFVNGKYWGVYTSGTNDTLNKTDRIVDQLRYSDKPIEYLFIAPYVLKTDNLETAGDFVEYLNNRIILTPGE
jgi:predicted deacetylase